MVKLIYHTLCAILTFSCPKFEHLNYTAIVLDHKPFLLVSWRYRNAFKLAISSLNFRAYHTEGSACIILPEGIDSISLAIRNLWHKHTVHIDLKRLHVTVQTSFSLVSLQKLPEYTYTPKLIIPAARPAQKSINMKTRLPRIRPDHAKFIYPN